MLAVVMGAPDYKVRFSDAASMINFGFGICKLYVDENQNQDGLDRIEVKGGTEKRVSCTYESEFRYLDTEGKALDQIEKVIQVPKHVKAPVKKGERAGKAVYTLDGKEIGSVNLLYGEDVEKAGYMHCVKEVWGAFLTKMQ